jgi:hypothetical protein
MSDLVKGALILAVAIIAGTAIITYFSPYQTCVRAERKINPTGRVEIQCAAALGRR